LDLSGYLTAQEIADTYAPLFSPVFSGIPEVPTPDYTVNSQAAPVSELVYMFELMTDILRGHRVICERAPLPVRPLYWALERDSRVKWRTERAKL
jgi:hypothetical protein